MWVVSKSLDFDTTEYLAEIALPLTRRWRLFLYGSRSEDDYDPASVMVFGTEREDDHTEFNATAVAQLGQKAYVTLRYQWVDHDVDPASSLLSYDRRIASGGITWYW